MKHVLSSLNDEQRKAIEYNSGPLLIVAGAGTGKTTALVEKIKYLISEKNIKPEEILALTFTEKAAAEMEERVDKALPYGYFQMWISTFHSFADQILREEISHIGLDAGYKLLTQAETILFLRTHLFLFQLKYFRPLGNPNKFLYALLQHFSRLKDENVTPDEYKTWAEQQQKNPDLLEEEKDKLLELANAYCTFQDLKVKEGYFDFSDLIYYVLELFKKRPHILEKYRKQFKYILVDEFQDTNIAQYILIKYLCPPSISPNLTVVGDDSQAIYKFRGASVSNILNFMKDYTDAHQITLNKNYRSNQTILDSSYQLIKHNDPDTLEAQLGISKRLFAQSDSKNHPLSFHLADSIDEETEFVAEQILALRQKHGFKFQDFALLVRANSHADPFITVFARNGIPYRFFGPGVLFKQPEVKDLIAYLKVLYNIEDSAALYRIFTMDLFEIDQRDISLLLAFAKKITLPLLQTCEIYLSFFHSEWFHPSYEMYRKFIPLLTENSREKLLKLIQMIHRHIGLLKKESAGQILYYFLEDTGYLKLLANYKTEYDEKIATNISKFFQKLKSYENEHEDASVFAVVDFIDMSMELGESPTSSDAEVAAYDAVNILTVHASKGLEFPVVFLANLSHGRFPTYEKKEAIPIPNALIKETLPQGDYHIQEERRLFYVALTRAKEYLFLTSSQLYGEGKRERKISPFVIETLGEDSVKNFQSLKKETKQQLALFDYKKPETIIEPQKSPFTISNFSYSQLESYATCPLQYKYQYILKIPSAPSGAASFGDSIHRSLQKYYEEFLKDRTLGLSRLIEIFHQQWIPVGYTSASHQNRMKKEGEHMLTQFFKTFHHEHISILGLEKLFKIKMDSDIYLTGKIDRVDINSAGEIEIIDYKTGKKPDDKELKKSLQLSIYALAATDNGLYNKQLSQVTLTFYYFQDMQKISMKRTEKELLDVKEKITKSVEQIRKNTFLPKVGPWCQFCSFKIICEAWQ